MTHASDPDALRTAQLAKEVRGLLFISTPGSHSSTLPVLHSGKLDVARGPALLDEAVGHDEKARNPARFRVRPQENPCLAFLKGLAGLLSHLGFSRQVAQKSAMPSLTLERPRAGQGASRRFRNTNQHLRGARDAREPDAERRRAAAGGR